MLAPLSAATTSCEADPAEYARPGERPAAVG